MRVTKSDRGYEVFSVDGSHLGHCEVSLSRKSVLDIIFGRGMSVEVYDRNGFPLASVVLDARSETAGALKAASMTVEDIDMRQPWNPCTWG